MINVESVTFSDLSPLFRPFSPASGQKPLNSLLASQLAKRNCSSSSDMVSFMLNSTMSYC